MTQQTEPQPDISSIAENLRKRFVDCAASTANEADVEQVMGVVIEDLNAAKREVTLKMLGLDNRWGKWEIDHCNGRQSPITNYLNDECNEMITSWVREAIKEVVTEELKGKLKKEIAEAFRKEVLDRGYRKQSMIEEAAQDINAEIINNVANELRRELGLKEINQ